MDSVLAVNVDELRVTALRHRQAEFAETFGLALDQYLKIVRSCCTEEVLTVLELLRASKFRSSYRESCARKIRSWILDVHSVGKPLNSWEFVRCRPTWKIPYSLPTLW